MEIEINGFDPDSIPADATILISGARHSGKSVLYTDLMYRIKHRLDICTGVNISECANHALEKFIPPALVFDSFSDTKLHQIMEWQRRSIANNRGLKVGLVYDDIAAASSQGKGGSRGPKKVMANEEIIRVFKMGRHLKLFFICALQNIKDAPPDIRTNVDFLFCFNTSNIAEREKIHKEYFGVLRNYGDFCKVFDACAKGHECIVIDIRKARKDPMHCIFYYHAALRTEPFHVGRPIFRHLSAYYLNESPQDYEMDPAKVLGVPAKRLGLEQEKLVKPDEDDSTTTKKEKAAKEKAKDKASKELTVVRH